MPTLIMKTVDELGNFERLLVHEPGNLVITKLPSGLTVAVETAEAGDGPYGRRYAVVEGSLAEHLLRIAKTKEGTLLRG